MAIRRALCWRYWIRSRILLFWIITWTSPSTCPYPLHLHRQYPLQHPVPLLDRVEVLEVAAYFAVERM
ncbi:hypothetical protein B0H12DRAFT_1117037 [Mycena haematopus]|nr:hypothetical protein B0H12DRAFT_1117037 [Mycena haematopus]